MSNLVLEYILANAVAARGFAPYFAILIGKVRAHRCTHTWLSLRLDLPTRQASPFPLSSGL